MAINLKWASLCILTIHNSLTVFVMRISKTQPEKYISSTAVVCSEVLKFFISLCLHVYFRVKELGSIKRYNVKMLIDEIFGKESDCLKTAVPAVLYLIQNNLQYFTMSKLDPATFQITAQMKHIVVAIFSVLLLKRHIFKHQWISIVLLAVGIALVQFPTGERNSSSNDNSDLTDKALGFLSVFIFCLLSSFAGVYFEKILKKSKVTTWARNVQLSLFSVVPGYFIGCLLMDGNEIKEKGFFGGYSQWTIYSIMCQAFSGIIVAVVIKYADNILKGFANSLSIILSCIIQFLFFDFNITIIFTIGCIIVLYSSYLYGKPVEKKEQNNELKIIENSDIDQETEEFINLLKREENGIDNSYDDDDDEKLLEDLSNLVKNK